MDRTADRFMQSIVRIQGVQRYMEVGALGEGELPFDEIRVAVQRCLRDPASPLNLMFDWWKDQKIDLRSITDRGWQDRRFNTLAGGEHRRYKLSAREDTEIWDLIRRETEKDKQPFPHAKSHFLSLKYKTTKDVEQLLCFMRSLMFRLKFEFQGDDRIAQVMDAVEDQMRQFECFEICKDA